MAQPAELYVQKLIHQSWRDSGFPKTLFNWRWQQGLVDLNPGWRLIQWTDETSRELIAREYAWFLPTYDAYPSYIQRSDAARYFIIYHHGGVYADLDIECSHGFEEVLRGHRAVFSYKQGHNMSHGLVNALFASEKRHPLWQTVFRMLTNRSALGTNAATHVDVGLRASNPWRSYEVGNKVASADAADLLGGKTNQPKGGALAKTRQRRDARIAAATAAAAAGAEGRPLDGGGGSAAKREVAATRSFAKRAYALRKERRRRAGGDG